MLFRSLKKGDASARSVVIRTFDLPWIPNSGWKQGRAGEIAVKLEQARGGLLTVMVLPVDDMIEIYAAYHLFLDAMSGNIDHVPEAAIAYIRTRLKPLFQRLFKAEPVEPSPLPRKPEDDDQPPEDLIRRIGEVVFREKFISVSELMAKLPPKWEH